MKEEDINKKEEGQVKVKKKEMKKRKYQKEIINLKEIMSDKTEGIESSR